MAEYKNCPVCHTINPPKATACTECGYKFREGEFLSDRDIARTERKKKRGRAVMTAVFAAVIIALCLIALIFGEFLRTILIVVGVAAVLFAIVVILYRIKSAHDRRRLR